MSQKLELIYENIDVLVAKNKFIVLPNEVFRFTKKMADARLVSYDKLMVAWDILTYKHDEKNPFPSHETLAEAFGVGKRAITGTISEIVKTGLFINEKGKYGTDKRKNTYNVSPLLNLLACFVERVREGVDVDIKELFKAVVGGNMKARKVSKQEEQPKEEVTMSEAIVEALNGLNETRKQALEVIVKKHIERLDEETIIFYINRVNEKCTNDATFYKFATTCFNNANNGDKAKQEAEAKKEAPKKQYESKKKAVRTEYVPSWLSGIKEEAELRYDSVCEETHSELLVEYEELKGVKIRKDAGSKIEAEQEHLIPAFIEWAKQELASQSEFATMHELGEHRSITRIEEMKRKLAEMGIGTKAN